MTAVVAAHSSFRNSSEAADDIARQFAAGIEGEPDAIILFASASHDFSELLQRLDARCRPRLLVGSSSAGEFTDKHLATGAVSALAIRSDELRLSASIGEGISIDAAAAASQLVAGFIGVDGNGFRYRAALIMTDALAGRAQQVVEQLTTLTAGRYLFAGGGAGDDANFRKTHVFLGTKVFEDAIVALEFLSNKPIGIGVGHGWEPASASMRATEVDGMRLVSLNGLPAVEAFEAHAGSSGQTFDRNDPMPFFLHNILGVDTGTGFRLRVPLALLENGSILCAAEIPDQARVHIMKTNAESAISAAMRATAAAVDALGQHKPAAAFFFDCVATRLRTGNAFEYELASVARVLDGAPFVGCNTYGQIARSEGQFSGFHNCTAVVMVLPEE